MSTHALLRIYDDEDRVIACIYKHWDGYPGDQGFGLALARFLVPFQITNGITSGDRVGEKANGMGCLAAQIIAHFKEDLGDVYLVPADAPDEEYVYELRPDKDGLCLLMRLGWRDLAGGYSGSPQGFIDWAALELP